MKNYKNMDYYEKKYKEAFRIGKTLIEKTGGTFHRKDLEDMFPELKESEDEKIRKAMLTFFKNYSEKGTWLAIPNVTEWISWLEKQGEPNDEEWSEEDETGWTNTMIMIKECASNHYTKDSIKLVIDWLKSLKDRCIPQQTPAWSEEDERNASYICAALDCYYRLREDRNNTNGQEDLDKARNWLYNKLKSLRPQNKYAYNPYKAVVESIAEMCVHYANSFDLEDFYDNVVVKCKDAKEYDSLYPQNTWKPSDEQIYWLKWAVNRMPDTEKANEAEAVLEGLLEHLKKIREE